MRADEIRLLWRRLRLFPIIVAFHNDAFSMRHCLTPPAAGEIRGAMKEADVATIVQRARETIPLENGGHSMNSGFSMSVDTQSVGAVTGLQRDGVPPGIAMVLSSELRNWAPLSSAASSRA